MIIERIASIGAFRLFVTIGLCMTLFSMGLRMGCEGPSLPGMTSWLQVSDAMMSYAKIASYPVTILGAVTSGYMFKFFGRDRTIIFSLFATSIAGNLIPAVSSYPLYLVMYVLSSAWVLLADIGCNVWVFELYREKNLIPLQFMNLASGLGSISGSFLVSFLLHQEQKSTSSHGMNTTLTLMNDNATTLSKDEDESAHQAPIAVVFSWAAIVMFFVGVYFTVGLLIFKLRRSKCVEKATINSIEKASDDSASSKSTSFRSTTCSKSEKSEKSDKQVSSSPDTGSQDEKVLLPRYKYWTFGWSIVMLGAQVGADLITNAYLSTFFIKKHFDPELSSHLYTTFLIGHIAARCCSIFLSAWFKPRTFIIGLGNLYMINVVGLFFASNHPEYEYWSFIHSALLGVGFSTLTPCMFSYINSRVRIKEKNSGLLFASVGIMTIVDPLLVGQFIATFPDILLIIILIHGICSLGGLTVIEYSFKVFNRNPDRYFKRKSFESDSAVEID